MTLNALDIVIFVAFVASVIGIGIGKSRHEGDSESYFLAGRGLSWWLIGFSLIAANISTEQFVGMSGQAADYVGLAIASYEWMAAITLVVVAFFFLPKFLQTGIYTIPEFLRHRYNEASRTIMATFTMIIYVFVTIAAVIYSGALVVNTLFPSISVVTASWVIGILAAVYVATGGLKACAWADLLQGSALILGGAIITYLAFRALGQAPVSQLATATAVEGLSDDASGITKFFALNADKLHMVLPMSDRILPWTALVVGLWIPNFYYWGLNQYITQRTLGSKSLAEGQKGVVFAAAMKLIIPFVIVFPGIAAFNLYSNEMADAAANDTQITAVWQEFDELNAATEITQFTLFEVDEGLRDNQPERVAPIDAYNERVQAAASAAGAVPTVRQFVGYKYDSAFGLLIGRLVPMGLRGFILAAILGAVVSSLASMLNSASTIFTMDLFRQYISKDATQKTLVMVGRICVGVFVVIGCIISPLLGDPKFKGIFTYIQEFQGYISPGILAVFVFGFAVRRAPPVCGVVGLLLNPVMYWILAKMLPSMAFLDRMALSFFSVLAVMMVITLIKPLPEPIQLPTNASISLETSKGAKIAGIAVVVATLVLYAIFW